MYTSTKGLFMNIAINKQRSLIGFLLLLLLSVITGFLMIKYWPIILPGLIRFKAAVTIIVSGLLIFALFLTGKDLFNNNPGLIIDENGITLNIGFTTGLIPRNTITGIKQISGSFNMPFIMVLVTNPQDYINKLSGYKKTTCETYLKTYGSPILITVKNLKGGVNQIQGAIEEILNGKNS